MWSRVRDLGGGVVGAGSLWVDTVWVLEPGKVYFPRILGLIFWWSWGNFLTISGGFWGPKTIVFLGSKSGPRNRVRLRFYKEK